MKKMKKLNLNKMRIVSLRNLQRLKGGNTAIGCLDTNICQDPSTSFDPDNCHSTGITHGGNDGGTFKSADGGPETQNCSVIASICELADM